MKQLHTARLRDPSALFAVVLFVVCVAAIVGSADYPLEGRLFPFVVGMVGALLALVFLLRTLLGAVDVDDSSVDLAGDLHVGVKIAYLRAARHFGWVVMYLLTISLLGATAATAAYVFLFLVFEGRVPIWKAALASAAMTLSLNVFLAQWLGLAIPMGVFEHHLRQLFMGGS